MTILDSTGRPANQAASTDCPRCHKARKFQTLSPSGGFGVVHPTCDCGHVFTGESWPLASTSRGSQ